MPWRIEQLARQIEAAEGRILGQVAQDVGELQGVAQRQRAGIAIGRARAEHPHRQHADRAGDAAAVALEHGHGRRAHRLAHPSPCRRSSRRTRRGAARSARSAPPGRGWSAGSGGRRRAPRPRPATAPSSARLLAAGAVAVGDVVDLAAERVDREHRLALGARAAGACPSRTRCPSPRRRRAHAPARRRRRPPPRRRRSRTERAHRAARPDAGIGAARPAPCRRGPSAMAKPLTPHSRNCALVELDPLRQRDRAGAAGPRAAARSRRSRRIRPQAAGSPARAADRAPSRAARRPHRASRSSTWRIGGRRGGPVELGDVDAGRRKAVERQVDAVQRPVVVLAVLHVVQHLQRIAQGVGIGVQLRPARRADRADSGRPARRTARSSPGDPASRDSEAWSRRA